MKKKILFWITLDLTQFCVAYNLQKNNDYDLYAIIDVPDNAQKFFETQKLVKFEKVWFFHDNIKKQFNPDLKYLEQVEKKYGINLWKLAINERIFYRFFDFHKFQKNEVLSILEQSCKLFEQVLKIKPDYVISKDPGFHHLEIFKHMCEKNGIQFLMPFVPKIGYKTMISNDPNSINSKNTISPERKNRNFNELRKVIESRDTRNQVKTSTDNLAKSRTGFIKSATKFLLSSNKSEENRYTYYGRTKSKVISFMLKLVFEERSRKKFIDNNLERKPKKTGPVVYFPMGVDLERNILIGAPYFTNQIEIIRAVAKSIPINYELWVKENPAQSTRSWRSISDYKKIMDLPNVKMIHPDVSNKKMFEESSLVVNIGGSSGLEALFYEKPTIVFSDTIYSKLSCVFRVTELEKLPEIIKNSLDCRVDEKEIDEFLTLIEDNSFEFDWFGFNTLQAKAFFYDGHLIDSEINENVMKEFLEKNLHTIDQISSEFIKNMK